MSPGFIAFKKNASLSLFLQKRIILLVFLFIYLINSSTGSQLPLSPFTRIWAKYLHSLANRATASFGLISKYLIMTRMKSSRRELESAIFD